MAAVDPSLSDPLLSLKRAISTSQAPLITSSADRGDVEDNLALATHLTFSFPNDENHAFLLNATTRFTSSDHVVDLRSILWAWQKKDAQLAEYISSTAHLNDELAASSKNSGAKVTQLSFVERLALISWLEGATDECEYIKPLANEAAAQQAGAAADVAAGAAGGVAVVPSATGAKVGGAKTVDPRLAEIYRGERKMGDRNTVLRGIKPTVSRGHQELKNVFSFLTSGCRAGLLTHSQECGSLPRTFEKPTRRPYTSCSSLKQPCACIESPKAWQWPSC